MTAVATFDPGKTVMKIAAVQEPVDDFLNVWLPKAEFRGKAFVVDADELFKVIFDTTVPIRNFRIAWAINCWMVIHGLDNIGE